MNTTGVSQKVLEALRFGAMTAEEIAKEAGITVLQANNSALYLRSKQANRDKLIYVKEWVLVKTKNHMFGHKVYKAVYEIGNKSCAVKPKGKTSSARRKAREQRLKAFAVNNSIFNWSKAA